MKMSHRRACLFPPASPSFFRGAEVVSLSPSFHPLPQERGSPQTRTRAEALPAAGRPLPPPARPSAPLGRPPPDGATPHGRRGARAPGSPPLPAAWAALRRTAPRRGESDPAEKTGRAEDPASGRGWRYGKDGPVRQAKGAPRRAQPAPLPSRSRGSAASGTLRAGQQQQRHVLCSAAPAPLVISAARAAPALRVKKEEEEEEEGGRWSRPQVKSSRSGPSPGAAPPACIRCNGDAVQPLARLGHSGSARRRLHCGHGAGTLGGGLGGEGQAQRRGEVR